jgi:CRP-like cAMP-binding protein
MLSSAERVYLEHIPLFQELSAPQLKKVSDVLHLTVLPARTNLLVADQRGEVVYFVIEGSVKIYMQQPLMPEEQDSTLPPGLTTSQHFKDVALNIVGGGEILGEISALDEGGHSAHVLTLEPCRVLWMSKEDFLRLIRAMPELHFKLSRLLAARLRLLSGHAFMMATMKVPQRVAYKLLALAQHHCAQAVREIEQAETRRVEEQSEAAATGSKKTEGRATTRGKAGADSKKAAGSANHEPVVLPFRVDQTDLADLVGASRVQAHNSLMALKEKGIINFDRKGNYAILDIHALKRSTF